MIDVYFFGETTLKGRLFKSKTVTLGWVQNVRMEGMKGPEYYFQPNPNSPWASPVRQR